MKFEFIEKIKANNNKNKIRDLIPIRSIEKDYISLTNGTRRRILIFNTINPITCSESQQADLVHKVNRAVCLFDEDLLIRSINLNFDLNVQINYWKNHLESIKDIPENEFEINYVKNILLNLSDVHDNKEIPNKAQLFIYEIKSDKTFNEKEMNFIDDLSAAGDVIKCDKNLLTTLLYKEFNIFNKNVEAINNKQYLPKFDNEDDPETDIFLSNLIANSMTFQPEKYENGDFSGSIYGLTGGKNIISFADFFPFSSHKNIDIGIHIKSKKSISSTSITHEVDKINVAIEHAHEENKSEIEINALYERKEMMKVAIEEIDKGGEKLVASTIYFRLNCDEEDCYRVFRELRTTIESQGYTVQNMHHKQRQAFMQSSILKVDTSVFDNTSFELKMSTGSLINTYPFTTTVESKFPSSTPFCWNGSNVVMFDPLLDPQKLSANNNNMIIIGQSGAGKTTLIKKLLIPEIFKKRKIFIIDPESEFSQLSKNLNAKLIKPKGHKINPLQPKALDYLDDNDNLQRITITEYIPNVIAFLRCLNPNIDTDIVANAIRETYITKGIDDNTDLTILKATDYPIFDDVFKTLFCNLYNESDYENWLKSDLENDKKYSIMSFKITSSATENTKYDYERTIRFMQSLTKKGMYGEYFNGHTTLKLNDKDKLYIFDLFSILQLKDDGLMAGMYFNILNFIEYGATQNKAEPGIVIADEAHLMLKAKLNFVVEYLESFSKRLRKNTFAMWLATQDIQDFTASEIADKAKKILSNSPIKITMNLEENQIRELETIYVDMTDSEKEIISVAKKGEGLMTIGKQKFPFKLILNTSELEMIQYNPTLIELKKLISRAEKIDLDLTDIDFDNEDLNALTQEINNKFDNLNTQDNVEIFKKLYKTTKEELEKLKVEYDILKEKVS